MVGATGGGFNTFEFAEKVVTTLSTIPFRACTKAKAM
jgi:hypothetical protein